MRLITSFLIILLLAVSAHAGMIMRGSYTGGGGATISDDFSGTLSNWTQGGSYAAITSGQLSFSGEGFIRHNTTLGSGNKYMRFRVTAMNIAGFIAVGCSSTGSCLAIRLQQAADWYVLGASIANYTTYTTYVDGETLTENNVYETFSASKYVGITLDKTNKVIRLWVDVTAAAPTSLTSWDGVAADTSLTFTSTVPGDYVGFGTWTGSPGTLTYDDFSAGDI